MVSSDALGEGDDWSDHYRGLSLQVNPDEDVWWQLYNGTERLQLDPVPTGLVDKVLELKPLGGRIHITEERDVLTRVEDGDEHRDVYVGEVSPEDLDGELAPSEAPEYGIPLRPAGLESGDLWPSVYDGSRYSFVGQRIWWQDGGSHQRHNVDGGFPEDILRTLQRYKSNGGSFRITPWGDVITLVPFHPAPETVEKQFGELPRVVQNIIKLRKERGVEMLPIYVGNLGESTISVTEPDSLTDTLSEEERDELSSWASGLGRTTSTSADSHQAENTSTSSEGSIEESSDESEDNTPRFDDDPMEWMRDDIEENEEDSL